MWRNVRTKHFSLKNIPVMYLTVVVYTEPSFFLIEQHNDYADVRQKREELGLRLSNGQN